MKPIYKIQFINEYTQEVIRAATFDSPETILHMIKGFEKTINIDEDSYIFDSNQRAYIAEYLTHNKITEDNTITYNLFFKTRLSDIQIPLG